MIPPVAGCPRIFKIGLKMVRFEVYFERFMTTENDLFESYILIQSTVVDPNEGITH